MPDPAKVYEGRPCKRGHTLRWRCNRKCVLCERARCKTYSARRRRENPDRKNEENRRYHENLTGFRYVKRLHKIDMAKRKRRIKRNEERRTVGAL